MTTLKAVDSMIFSWWSSVLSSWEFVKWGKAQLCCSGCTGTTVHREDGLLAHLVIDHFSFQDQVEANKIQDGHHTA